MAKTLDRGSALGPGRPEGRDMIWSPERNAAQGQLVAGLYAAAAGVPCWGKAIMAGGLPGAGTLATVQAAGTDLASYLTVSISVVLEQMAGQRLIPVVAGLSPLEAADLVHAEAQFIAKRIGMLALADGRNVLLDISWAARPSTDSWLAALRACGYEIHGVFADITIDESLRRTDAAHRRGEEERRAGRGHGGRFIPPEAIRALADDPSAPPGPAPDPRPGWYPGGGITDLIAAYRAGDLTLAELAATFRAYPWAAVPRAWAPGLEDARAAIDDFEPLIPGTFDDVVLAYDQHQLTDADYAALARAAARLAG
jgi:hypothetical protein